MNIDYAMLVKIYGGDGGGPKALQPSGVHRLWEVSDLVVLLEADERGLERTT